MTRRRPTVTATVLEAINKQVTNQFTASFSYLSMAAWCEHNNFMGAGAWLRLQSAEEHGHAMRLFNFLLARNHQVTLIGIDPPKSAFNSLLDVFENSLAQ